MSSTICDCSICLSPISTETGKVNMACSHSYHYRCITNWFIEQNENDQKETCPYCRREASEDEALPKIDELSVEDDDEESEEDNDSETDFDSESDSEADSESVVEDIPLLNTELIMLADRLHTDLHSLEAYKRGIQIKVREETATLTDQSILNRILAYEVDMQEKLKNLLEMEDLQVWRMGSSAPAPAAPPSTPQGHDQKVAEWRAKVDALWPSLSIQAPFNPEDEDEEDMYEEDQELRRRITEQLMRQIKGIGAVVGRG
jgi:hypothetical protein